MSTQFQALDPQKLADVLRVVRPGMVVARSKEPHSYRSLYRVTGVSKILVNDKEMWIAHIDGFIGDDGMMTAVEFDRFEFAFRGFDGISLVNPVVVGP